MQFWPSKPRPRSTCRPAPGSARTLGLAGVEKVSLTGLSPRCRTSPSTFSSTKSRKRPPSTDSPGPRSSGCSLGPVCCPSRACQKVGIRSCVLPFLRLSESRSGQTLGPPHPIASPSPSEGVASFTHPSRRQLWLKPGGGGGWLGCGS